MQMADPGARPEFQGDEGERRRKRKQLYYYMTPSEMGDGQSQSISTVWIALQEVTTVHGLPNFHKSRGRHP